MKNKKVTEGKTLSDIVDDVYTLGYESINDDRDSEGKTILIYKQESTPDDNFEDFNNDKLYDYLSKIPNVRYQVDDEDPSTLAIWLKESKKVESEETNFKPKDEKQWNKYIKEIVSLEPNKITFVPTKSVKQLNSEYNESYAKHLKQLLVDNFGELIDWRFAEDPCYAIFKTKVTESSAEQNNDTIIAQFNELYNLYKKANKEEKTEIQNKVIELLKNAPINTTMYRISKETNSGWTSHGSYSSTRAKTSEYIKTGDKQWKINGRIRNDIEDAMLAILFNSGEFLNKEQADKILEKEKENDVDYHRDIINMDSESKIGTSTNKVDYPNKRITESKKIFSTYELEDVDDFESAWDDYTNVIVPEIKSQCRQDILVMAGTVGRWNGNYNGGAVIDVDDLPSFGGDVDYVELEEDDGNVLWLGIHHDGTHTMQLFTIPEDIEARKKICLDLGIVDWLKNIYDYDTDEQCMDDALSYLDSPVDLNDIFGPEEYEKADKYFTPIKASSLLGESKKVEMKDINDFYTDFNAKDFYTYTKEHLASHLGIDNIYSNNDYETVINIYDKELENTYSNYMVAQITYDKKTKEISVQLFKAGDKNVDYNGVSSKYTDIDEAIDVINNHKYDYSKYKKAESKKVESNNDLQMEIYEMIQNGRKMDNQNKETNIKETYKAILEDHTIDEFKSVNINTKRELLSYIKLKVDEIYDGEFDK